MPTYEGQKTKKAAAVSFCAHWLVFLAASPTHDLANCTNAFTCLEFLFGELLKGNVRRFSFEAMIIVFAEDQTVSVFSDMASVQGACEAIDVEEGACRFFDELGRSLAPRFITPVRRTTLLFGIKLIGGGNFELDLDPQDKSAFETSLANAVAIEPNPWFATLVDLGRYVDENRKRENEI